MNILYINLDTRVDRKIKMEQQFLNWGLHAHRIEAVNKLQAKEMGQIDIRSLNNIFFNTKTSNFDLDSWAAVACFESHKKAWKYCLEQGWDSCWILEDDAIIKSVLNVEVSSVLPLVWLGLRGKVETRISNCAYPLLKYNRKCFGAHAYCIHASLLQELIWASSPPYHLSLSVDFFINEYCLQLEKNVGVLNLCTTREFLSFSDIEHTPILGESSKNSYCMFVVLVIFCIQIIYLVFLQSK